jgi:hypothetical protein
MLFGLEDGPADGDGLHSQLYLYLGDKQPQSSDPLARNGLRDGQLYVLAGDDPQHLSEAGLHARGDSTHASWKPLPWDGTDEELDAAAKATSAFGFVRIEDGACDPTRPGILYFVTTGAQGTTNPLGRLYRLRFDPQVPLLGAELTVLLDGSEGVVRPDNIDVNEHGELAILEDPGKTLHDSGLERDSSVWMYEIATGNVSRIATVDREAARRHALEVNKGNAMDPKRDAPGEWETSGIIDAERYLGRGTWICTVQAHGLTIVPSAETVEGGQILELIYK